MAAVIGGAFGFAGSALSQLAEGKGFKARKAWGAVARSALITSGAVKGGACNIADVLGNRLRNAYNAGKSQKLRKRNT